MLKRIHVNQHNIRANKKNGTNLPVITVKTSKANIKCNDVQILGPSTVVYRAEKPLACGAKVWIETTAQVLCDNQPIEGDDNGKRYAGRTTLRKN